MKAIDLYAGIGGWATGFHLAGIETVAAWEWWGDACDTYELNFGLRPRQMDIRGLSLADLPEPGTIDFVVGSPPCTEFSYSNRGGNGDIAEGLLDVRKFLEIVDYLKPRYWAMENVPRVAKILASELETGGSLDSFRHLVKHIKIVRASDYGTPQDRDRMIAGNFPSDLFEAYKSIEPKRTLGRVIECLSATPAIDPVYGSAFANLTDQSYEPELSHEEERINREMKTYHPVYNNMPFPDQFGRPARTVTATCTRVSRESIIVPFIEGFRRLTVRERASVQGFPASFLLAGKNVNSRFKMAGNAIPPPVTYYLAQAMLEVDPEAVKPLESLTFHPAHPERWKPVMVDIPPRQYPPRRSFRHCIPGLRFKSGVRYEVQNQFLGKHVAWTCNFYFGSSKSIRQGFVNKSDISNLLLQLEWAGSDLIRVMDEIAALRPSDNRSDEIQSAWSHRQKGYGPFDLVDDLGDKAHKIRLLLDKKPHDEIVRACTILFPEINRGKSADDYLGMLSGAFVLAGFSSDYEQKKSDRQLLLALERQQAGHRKSA